MKMVVFWCLLKFEHKDLPAQMPMFGICDFFECGSEICKKAF